VARAGRTRPAGLPEARRYLGKAEEYLDAARDSLAAERAIAATSLAVHAGINAADAICAARLGKRAAGTDHHEAGELLEQAGTDGIEAGRSLRRLLPLKTKAEYEPDDVALPTAGRAVGWAAAVVAVARRVLASTAR
jgi:hypothetical protein